VEFGKTTGKEGYCQDETGRYSEPSVNPPEGWSKVLREMYPHETSLPAPGLNLMTTTRKMAEGGLGRFS